MPTQVKCSSWPKVLVDDAGLRARLAGRCNYCEAWVGAPHERDCVCVEKLTRWRVLVGGVPAGTLDEYLPHGWDDHGMWFRMNESSWCATNCLDRVVWDDGVPPGVAAISAERDDENRPYEGPCHCGVLTFELVGVVDEGPFVERPDPQAVEA